MNFVDHPFIGIIVAYLPQEDRLKMNSVSPDFYGFHVPFACWHYPHRTLNQMLATMLNTKPIGADERGISRWDATNRMTIEMFKAFWQKVSPHLTIEAGDEASYIEWMDKYSNKHQGARMPGGARHGIVRTINSKYGWIEEETYYEDKKHGLSFTWFGGNYDYCAFEAHICDPGEEKAFITWNKDWSELYSDNKELILENNGLSIFKP